MIAKQLESILADASAKIDFAVKSPADLVQRFQSLRGYALLPKSRGRNAEHLTSAQAAAGILALVTEKPGFAGLAAKVLLGLRPVGGPSASFNGCKSLGEALALILDKPEALSSLLELRLSGSEIYTNGHGRAALEFIDNGVQKTAYFVGELAVSLMQPGAEKFYNPRGLISSTIAEMVFYPSLFRRISRALRVTYPIPIELSGEELEIEEERRKEKRAERLGIRAGSRFLNVEVGCQVEWPKEETAVEFEGHRIILMPKTREHSTSLHIDLTGEKISTQDAHTLFNRFLSMMTWCRDQFAILKSGWSGNPVPVPVPKSDLAFATATHWVFSRQIPVSREARLAIAIYREARNAQQNQMIPYAVLSYYKIVELKYKAKADVKKWFRQAIALLRKKPNLTEGLAEFERACNSERPEDYLYRACRCAVAHANKPFSTDPDDFIELRRLHVAADILRAGARLFIADELGVSDCMYDGT